jgi:anti-sigma factor RsiW
MNRPTHAHAFNDELTADDLRAYRAGQLSGAALHRVERLLLENPLYADALDGLDALQQVGVSLHTHTRTLHQALQARVESLAEETATPRRLMPLWIASAAASILLVMSVAIYYVFYVSPRQQKAPAAIGLEPGTVLLDTKSLGTVDEPEHPPANVPAMATVAPTNAPARVAPKRKYQVRSAMPTAAEVLSQPTLPSIDEVRTVAQVRTPRPSVEVDTDIMPLPNDKTELQRRRTVDTERAFLE